MKLLGQTVCLHARPLCGICPLRDICLTGRDGRRVETDSDCPDETYGSDERFERPN
jgi:adenine-specific DNA glycosylase